MSGWQCPCGENRLSKMKNRKICNSCAHEKYHRTPERVEYSREWMRARRWLDGGPDRHLVGDVMPSMIRGSHAGRLRMERGE